MNAVITILMLTMIAVSPSSDPKNASYWESKGKDPILVQIIHTPDDQGRDILHINMFLSSSCTTKIYYAMPIDKNDHYVLTDTKGEVIDQSVQLIIKPKKKLKLNNKTYIRIDSDKYFEDMKRFEKNKRY